MPLQDTIFSNIRHRTSQTIPPIPSNLPRSCPFHTGCTTNLRTTTIRAHPFQIPHMRPHLPYRITSSILPITSKLYHSTVCDFGLTLLLLTKARQVPVAGATAPDVIPD